eukprot:COSAG02_NODE_5005_length_4726_cov_78.139615_1_plen_61_part_10
MFLSDAIYCTLYWTAHTTPTMSTIQNPGTFKVMHERPGAVWPRRTRRRRRARAGRARTRRR